MKIPNVGCDKINPILDHYEAYMNGTGVLYRGRRSGRKRRSRITIVDEVLF